MLLLLSRFCGVRLFPTPWSAAYQAPPSLGFSRQEYWSEVPLPSPGNVLGHVNSQPGPKLTNQKLGVVPAACVSTSHARDSDAPLSAGESIEERRAAVAKGDRYRWA